jgi:hypothetical protein
VAIAETAPVMRYSQHPLSATPSLFGCSGSPSLWLYVVISLLRVFCSLFLGHRVLKKTGMGVTKA